MTQQTANRKGRRHVSAWFPYQDASSWDALAPHADVLGSVSVFGKEAPCRGFFDACHERGIAAIKLVGGKAAAFDTREHAAATVRQYVRDCEETGFDGIDLDFEHIDPSYKERYSDFVREVAAELHKRGKRLSICVFAIDINIYGGMPARFFHEPAVLGEACDEVRVMCYDMYLAHGIWYGPTSTRLWARSGMMFWLEHVPREKLIMALPAYSNDYGLMPGCGYGRQQGCDSPEALPGTHDVEKLWLPYDRIHVYRYLDGEGKPRLFFASDGESTRAHLETVDELDIPGISFWHYGTMSPGIWQAVTEWLG